MEHFKTSVNSISDLKAYIGKEVGLTEWIDVTQDNIDAFAKATHDFQWIHTDPVAAEEQSPYGKTIAHGFLSLSLIPKFTYECVHILNVSMGVNYGLDRVRFPHVLVVDSFIRGRVKLLGYEDTDDGARLKFLTSIEIKGQDKPACVAEFIAQLYS